MEIFCRADACVSNSASGSEITLSFPDLREKIASCHDRIYVIQLFTAYFDDPLKGLAGSL